MRTFALATRKLQTCSCERTRGLEPRAGAKTKQGGKTMSQVILHHYALSPYSEKTRLAMGLKGMNWNSVEIPVWMPRPKLTPMTGGYRRTPILQVGAEFYCDTLHILQTVKTLSASGALYPKGQEGLAKAFG